MTEPPLEPAPAADEADQPQPKVLGGRGVRVRNGAEINLYLLDDNSVQLYFLYQGRLTPIRLSTDAMAALVCLWVDVC
jgi:hypothetical protein